MKPWTRPASSGDATESSASSLSRRGLLRRALQSGTASFFFPAAPEGGAHARGPGVASVENSGLLFTDNPAGVSGTDAGYSLPLGNQTLWLFGDVFLLQPSAPTRNYVGGVSNCGLLVPRGVGPTPLRRYRFLTDPRTGLARPLLPNMPGEGNDVRLWPFGGWHDASNRAAYLYYAMIRTTSGGGPFDFRTVGMGLARADVSRLEQLRFERLGVPEDGVWWPAGGPLFGAAVVSGTPRNDPFLYIIGYEEQKGTKRGKLARVPRKRIASLAAYEYYAGGGSGAEPRWMSDPKNAADVSGLFDFPSELSVAWNTYLGGYLAVHSVGVSPRVRLSFAPRPWGPYTQIAEIGTPHRAFEKAFCYAGKEHPELAEAGGRIIYVTYVDSQRYWLQLLKITLTR